MTPAGSTLFVTYFGGSGEELAYGIAVDSAGRVSVAGQTSSPDLPVMHPLQPHNAGGVDAFVATFSPAGSSLRFATYLGGSGEDIARGIAVDPQGAIHIAGGTRSPDFPAKNALQPAYGGGVSDAFAARLSPESPELIYSTYLGGRYEDYGFAVAADSHGNTYLTGATQSLDFPAASALQPESGGGICGSVPCADIFITKIGALGSLTYSTYLGGNKSEYGVAMAVDLEGNAYVAGSSHSDNFPTLHPLQPLHGGGSNEGIVAKLNASGSALIYSTYLGGRAQDYVAGIAVDTRGNAYLTGLTESRNFPVKRALQSAFGGGRCGFNPCSDAFVTKLDPDGLTILYSTYLGGIDGDGGIGIAVDRWENAHVVGNTLSMAYPRSNPLQAAHGRSRYNYWLATISHDPGQR